jgi:hypothetical protein
VKKGVMENGRKNKKKLISMCVSKCNGTCYGDISPVKEFSSRKKIFPCKSDALFFTICMFKYAEA